MTASASELVAGILAADKAGNTEDAQAFAEELKAHPDYRGDASGWLKVGEGVLGKASKLVNAVGKLTSLTPVGGLMNRVSQAVGGPDLSAPLKGYAEHYEKEISPQLGWQGAAGEAGVDVAASLVPVAKGAQMATPLLAAGARVLPRALQGVATRAAPAVADVGANATWSGGTALLEGDSLKDAGKKALWAAGGAAAGRTVAAAARGGARAATPGAVTPEAARLYNEGIAVTPGQAMPRSMFAKIEESGKRLPVLAGAIEARQGDLASTLITRKADDALSHIGGQSEGQGLRMVRNGDTAIDNAYQNVVPRTIGNTSEVLTELGRFRTVLDTVPFLSTAQKREIQGYIRSTILPEVNKHGPTIDGRTMRDLDIKLGAQARGYQESLSPDHWPMGKAIRDLQQIMRQATKGMDAAAKQDMANVNQAFRLFLPVEHATMRSLNQGGTPTPVKLLKSMEKYNQSGKTAVDPLVDAAVITAPKSGAGGSNPAATIGDRALQLAAAYGLHLVPGGKLAGLAGYGATWAAYRSPEAMRTTLRRIQGLRRFNEGVRNSQTYQTLKRNRVATRLGGLAGTAVGDRQRNKGE